MENAISPAWFNYKDAAVYSGLSARLLQDLVRRGYVVSSAVVQPGSTRGRRLISRTSLDSWIEKGIGGSNVVNFRTR